MFNFISIIHGKVKTIGIQTRDPHIAKKSFNSSLINIAEKNMKKTINILKKLSILLYVDSLRSEFSLIIEFIPSKTGNS